VTASAVTGSAMTGSADFQSAPYTVATPSVVAALHAADGAGSAVNAVTSQRGGCSTSVYAGQIPEESIYIGRMTDGETEINAAIWSDKDLGIDAQTSAKSLVESHELEHGKKVMMQRGNVVFAPQVDTIVETPFGTVAIDAGSLVLVMSSPTSTGVYNFDDSHRNAVVIRLADRKMPVAPGRHVLVTHERVGSFDMVNPAETFAYRNTGSTIFGAHARAFAGEFHVPTAFNSVSALRQLITSRNGDARRIVNHLLKTIAIVMQMHAGAGDYQQMPHLSGVAYAP